MSLTISEAAAINHLIERLTGVPSSGYSDCPTPTDEQLLDDVRLLAAKAHRALMAGFSAERAEVAVRGLLDREAEIKEQAEAALASIDETVIAWELAAARAIVMQLDGTGVEIDDQEWALDAIDEPDPDEITLTHQSGRAVLARISVRVIEGALS